MAIRRILIANRGEIAVRVIRTCKALGIETVLAASAADLDSLPSRLADRTICIGPARPADSYLRVDAIVQAALGVKADAIHPGYGFLSERPALARICEQEGVMFIGPTARPRSRPSAINCAPAPKPSFPAYPLRPAAL